MMFCAVLIRSQIGANPRVKTTLKLLKLKKRNNMMIYRKNDYYKGMLERAKDFIAYGEINTENLVKLLEKRAYIKGRKLSSMLKELGYKEIKLLAEDLESGKIDIKYLVNLGLEIPFRLNSPRKGLKNSKKAFSQNGSLGNWGEKINLLLARMI
jgi:large subunit ribosomal protein L30